MFFKLEIMKTPATKTKFLIPRRRPDLISRSRLLDLLADILDYRITLIAAPAGYGKTSLLVDFAHKITYPICWYALDSLDVDLSRFIFHFISAIQHNFPIFGENSFAVLQSSQQTGLDLANLVTTLVNDIYENISEHFAIVLDDYHLIDSNDDINQFVSKFAQEMDENCHLIIASRTLMSLPDLPLMVGRSQAIGLSFEELAFQPHEIQALLERNYNQQISEETARELVDETEGWITGLLLSAETMWQGMTDRVRVARTAGIHLYDYLAQQVLEQQNPDVQDFLLATSLLEEFNAEMCAAVLGKPAKGKSWALMIAAVVQNNLFVQPVENGDTWLRYHHLFQDFLQDRMKAKNPEKEKEILKRLVEWYAEREEWEKAYAICTRLEDDAFSADFILQAGSPLASRGKFKLLSEWLDDLPPSRLNENSSLIALSGAVKSTMGDLQSGLVLFDNAVNALSMEQNQEMLAKVLTWRATTKRHLGKLTESLNDADSAQHLTKTKRSLQPIQAEALRTKGLALYDMGKGDEAIEALLESERMYTLLNDDARAAYVQVDLGYVLMETGDHKRAFPRFRHALEIFQNTKDLIQLANVYNNLGVLSHLEGEILQAESYFSEALNCAKKSGYSRIESYALAGISDIFIDLELLESALELNKKAQKIGKSVDEKSLVSYLSIAEARIARKSNQATTAQKLINRIGILLHAEPTGYETGLLEIEKGCLFLHNDNLSGAQKAFRTATSIFSQRRQKLDIIRAQIYSAFIAHLGNDQEQILKHLNTASQIASELSNLFPLLSVSQDAITLLREYKGNAETKPFVEKLIRIVDAFETQKPSLRRQLRQRDLKVSFSPPELNIKVFGQSTVELNGVRISKPEWTNQKTVRELFFLLLENPDGLTKDAISDYFWPNSTHGQFQKQFNNTIYRLRRALGKNVIQLDSQSNRYQFNRKMDYQYDAEIFQSRIAQAKNIQNIDNRIIAFQEALEIYQGEYLPEIEGIWAIPIREYLHRSFVDAILQTAKFFFDRSKFEKALDYCHLLLSEDPCHEAAHRIIMRIYSARGNRAEISRQYFRCQQSLRHLDTKPSPETVELFEQLMFK